MNTALSANAELTGQIAVVTGAAQGLGLGIARELAARGARVVIADLQQEKAATAADSLTETGLSVVATQVDISDSDSVDHCFARLVDAHWRIDVVVNNAGVGQHVAPIVLLWRTRNGSV